MTKIYLRIAKIKRISWFKIRSFFEKLKGIETLKYVTLEELGLSENEGIRYEPSKKKILHIAIKEIKEIVSLNNVAIIDLGCGKGRALIELSKYPFRKIGGLEYSNDILNICKNNLRKLKLWNIELFCMNVLDFKNYEEYDIYYFYNPFPQPVFKKVLENLIENNKKNKKPIYIIYIYATCHSLIMKSGYFNLIKKIENENKIFQQADDIYIYKNIN